MRNNSNNICLLSNAVTLIIGITSIFCNLKVMMTSLRLSFDIGNRRVRYNQEKPIKEAGRQMDVNTINLQ